MDVISTFGMPLRAARHSRAASRSLLSGTDSGGGQLRGVRPNYQTSTPQSYLIPADFHPALAPSSATRGTTGLEPQLGGFTFNCMTLN